MKRKKEKGEVQRTSKLFSFGALALSVFCLKTSNFWTNRARDTHTFCVSVTPPKENCKSKRESAVLFFFWASDVWVCKLLCCVFVWLCFSRTLLLTGGGRFWLLRFRPHPFLSLFTVNNPEDTTVEWHFLPLLPLRHQCWTTVKRTLFKFCSLVVKQPKCGSGLCKQHLAQFLKLAFLV